MDKQKKIKFQNAARVIGGHVGLSAIAIVAAAIEPVLGAVRTGKMLKKRKENNHGHELYKEDIKEALGFYAKHILAPGEIYKKGMDSIIRENKEKLVKDKYNTPEMLQKTGVADLIKLIENAPVVERRKLRDHVGLATEKKYECIMIGDMWVIKLDNKCVVGTEKLTWNDFLHSWSRGTIVDTDDYWGHDLHIPKELLEFPVSQYVSVDNAAIGRMRKLKQQDKEAEKSAFSAEVAKRIGKDR